MESDNLWFIFPYGHDQIGSNFLIDFYSINAIESLTIKSSEYWLFLSVIYGHFPSDLPTDSYQTFHKVNNEHPKLWGFKEQNCSPSLSKSR